ncbi:MAG: LysM peptidoglycan-binding domain-containing protein [Chloroflexota bacterium]
MLRAVCLLALVAIPAKAHADYYLVKPGDTLTSVARRFNLSVGVLARANDITNVNLVRAGQELLIPVRSRNVWYRVKWGDTLSGISLRYHISASEIHALNPRLGAYPLAGELLRLCSPCAGGGSYRVATTASGSLPSSYVVRAGDTLSAIGERFGVSPIDLMAANHLLNPDRIIIGTRLMIPRGLASPNDPWQARSLIGAYAGEYGVAPSLPLAVAFMESGFNQTLVSRTGAIGVMQVEPYTGQVIANLWRRPVNLYNVDDNVHAGVYWLSYLLGYYRGNEYMAVGAYYEGTKAIAHHGLYADTVRYVNDVLSLQRSFL